MVTFSYIAWITRYPEFAPSVEPMQAQAFFNEACLYCDNTSNSPITDDSVGGQRFLLLNMLTAHIAALNASINGQAPSALVGRITNASEGSVSVGAQLNVAPGSAQWYAQTRYGLAYWQATAQFRIMNYQPGNAPIANPFTLWR